MNGSGIQELEEKEEKKIIRRVKETEEQKIDGRN